MKKKVLFISPDASRTGAPLVLLNFIEWFKNNTDIPFIILLQQGGGLQIQFKQLGRTYVYTPSFPKISILYRIIEKLFIKPFFIPFYQFVIRLSIRKGITHIYSNTVVNGNLLKKINITDAQILSHIHELKSTIDLYGKQNIDYVKKFTNKYIVPSTPVKLNLINQFDIPIQLVSVIPEFIKFENYAHKSVQTILDDLKIPKNSFIVGGSGITDWRKGTDVFIEVANHVINKAKLEDVYFVWVGKNDDWLSENFQNLRYDIEKLNLSDRVIFTGEISNPYDYYQCFDVFALTSREDPFPLVCLENAHLGNPIICFENGGGMPDFVGADAGYIVSYLDIGEYSEKIINLYSDRDLLKTLGAAAKLKLETNYQPDRICSSIYLELFTDNKGLL
jgi:glycosyltransferase involved in cell wall biosynthesis